MATTPSRGATLSADPILDTEPLGRIPCLDGLRAVAVVAVLGYHSRWSWIEGGFLGVSVFFTLSGFLITSLVLREWARTSTVSLSSFWSRRFRRLLPAAWTTLTVVIAMGAAGVWNDDQLRSLRGDVPWSVAQLVNWHFIASGTSYGDAFGSPSPLEHFWSLAIEEQFYLLLPLLVVGVLAVGRTRAPRRRLLALGGLLSALLVASSAANALTATRSVDQAYFGTHTRAAELLVGALLAMATLRRTVLPRRPARIAAWMSVPCLGVLLWLFHAAELQRPVMYPWGFLLSAACTAGVILGTIQGGVLSRVLSTRPTVALGRISYGVYLLHWPVFLWLSPERTGLAEVPLLIVRLAVTLGAATAMYHLVEQPIRHNRSLGIRQLGPAAVAAICVLVSATIVVTREVPPPPDYLVPRDVDDPVDVREAPTTTSTTTSLAPEPPTPDSSTPPVTTAAPPTTRAPRPPSRVLLLGDSIAGSLDDALGDALLARGISYASAPAPGCGVVTGDPADADGRPLAMAAACNSSIPRIQQNAVARSNPDLVVLLSTWEAGSRIVDGRFYRFGTPEGDAMLRRLYQETFRRVGNAGAQVALVTVPVNVDAPGRPASASTNEALLALNQILIGMHREDPSLHMVRLDQIVCPTSPCPTVVENMTLRPTDGVHYDDPVAARWVADRLAAQIAALDLGPR